MKIVTKSILVCCIAVFSTQLFGHARFTLNGALKSRTGSSGLKTAPCGIVDSKRADNPTSLIADQEIEIEWIETIDHPGSYEINFLPDWENPQNSQQIMVVADEQNGAQTIPHYYKATITVPNQTCDNCVFQLIQRMDDAPDRPYYSCADVVIEAADDSTATTPKAPDSISITNKP